MYLCEEYYNYITNGCYNKECVRQNTFKMSDHKYCVQSLKEKKISENATYELFDFGEALEQIYPLLQIIFENLPYEDLKTALLVNNTWNKYSKDELRKRNNASWLSLSRTKASQLTIQKSNNFKYDSVAFALIFYNYHDIKLQKFICVHDEPVKRMTCMYISNCKTILCSNLSFRISY